MTEAIGMKKEALLLSIILVLVLSGCAQQGPGEQRVDEDFHRGTRGLDISFVRNAPPDRVYEADSLDISIAVKNKGAFPEGPGLQGKLEISGFDPISIRGSWDGGNAIPTSLEGKSQFNPQGGEVIMSYKDRDGVHVPFDADFYEPTILIHACYKYKTIADTVVCIDPDPYKVVEERKVCTIQDVSTGGGQGAPIAVTRIEEEVGSDNIFFRIHVSNVGGGSVMLPRAYTDCPFDIEFEELDKVTAKVKLPYDASPNCTPRGTASDPIRLTGGKGVIFCKFKKPNTASAFTTSLNVELEYTYSSSISRQLRIINIR